jgi:putative oxidoreductase
MGIDPGWGITLVRIAMAAVLIQAGYSKVFVLGHDRVTQGMTKYGLPAPEVFAFLAAYGELIGGIALLIGLFARWLGLFYAVQFAIALFWVKVRMQGWGAGYADLMLLAAGLLFFLAGPGRAAIDSLWLERPGRRLAGLDRYRRAA